MILAILLAAVAPAPMSAIDAERAFAADAQRTGQWTAFRKWSAPRAMMFVPAPTNAHQFLSPRKDPPQSVFWWPGRSYVSCDGNLAINTGPWVRGYGKTIGYFTTVWARQSDGGWKWVYDGGDELEFARDEGGDIKQVNASCATPAPPHPAVETFGGDAVTQDGGSRDGSLRYFWQVAPDGKREFHAWLWDGAKMQPVIVDKIAAPQ